MIVYQHLNGVIDESSKKKVLGYDCIKATTVFRGSKITAYFTRSIPYSIGPFKFLVFLVLFFRC